MPTLTITAKGQITLRREILDHLGLRPGDRLDVDLLAPGQVQLSPSKAGSIDDFIGCLPDRGVRLSIDEIEASARAGWSRE